MINISEEELNFLGQCFIEDIDINKRLSSPYKKNDLAHLVRIFTTYAKDSEIVYTAFDGDHFHLLQNMRKCVLSNNRFPANPESVLGYKNIVSRYQNKYGVLMDDLAILQSCDELWVFTDYGTSLNDILELPEGVLVEIAFFLKRRVSPIINFVSLSTLLTEGKTNLKRISLTFEDVEEALKRTKRSEIIDMANNNFKVDKDLKNLVFYITDPLDHKYSEWLRDSRSSNTDEIALVPGLTTRISDADFGLQNIGNIVLSWAAFLLKLSKKRAYTLESFDSKRNPSLIATALKEYCIQIKGKKYLDEKDWSSFSIPKGLQKEKWPITSYEANLITK